MDKISFDLELTTMKSVNNNYRQAFLQCYLLEHDILEHKRVYSPCNTMQV